MSPPWAKDMLAGTTISFAHLLMDFRLLGQVQERNETAFICFWKDCSWNMSTMPCLFAVGHHFWVQTQDEDKQLAKPEMKVKRVKLAISGTGKYHHSLKEREAKPIQTTQSIENQQHKSVQPEVLHQGAWRPHLVC